MSPLIADFRCWECPRFLILTKRIVVSGDENPRTLVQPLCGARGRESSGTGLKLSKQVLFLLFLTFLVYYPNGQICYDCHYSFFRFAFCGICPSFSLFAVLF